MVILLPLFRAAVVLKANRLNVRGTELRTADGRHDLIGIEAFPHENLRTVNDDAAIVGDRHRMHSERADILLMSGELAFAVVGGAVQWAIESPVLFFPVHLAVSMRAPARQ